LQYAAANQPMKRIMLVTLAALAIIATSLLIFDQVGAWITASKINESKVHWTSVVNSEIQIGESKDQVDRWLNGRLAKNTSTGLSTYDPNTRSFYFTGNLIKVVGFQYPCSAWQVEVEIGLGPDDRVKSRKVTLSGACV
jgi:hypothetical protein